MLLIGTRLFSSVAVHVKWRLEKEASPMRDLSQAVEKICDVLRLICPLHVINGYKLDISEDSSGQTILR